METKKPNYAEESMSEQQRTAKRERVAVTSGDVLEGQVTRLRELFPEVFVEGKIDFEKLKVMEALKVRPSMAAKNQRILERYINDMRGAIREVARVLFRAGKAVYIVGENTLRGTYIPTSIVVSKLAEFSGLRLQYRRKRALPANRRYLPPPRTNDTVGAMNVRMQKEVVLAFAK